MTTAESDHTLPLPSFPKPPSGNLREEKITLLFHLGSFLDGCVMSGVLH